MSDSFEDYPPARAFDDQMTTAEINDAISIKFIQDGLSVAMLQADVNYWRNLFLYTTRTKAECRCLGRQTPCRKCEGLDRYTNEVGTI